jgi:hypothetical protein
MTTIEKLMRAHFETWRSRMDDARLHPHSMHAFEDLNEREFAFALEMARASVRVIKERLAGTACELALDNILLEAPDAQG